MDLSKLNQEFDSLDQNSSTSNNLEVELLKLELAAYKEYANETQRSHKRLQNILKGQSENSTIAYQNWVPKSIYEVLNNIYMYGGIPAIIEKMMQDIQNKQFNIIAHGPQIDLVFDKDEVKKNLHVRKLAINLKIALDEIQQNYKLKSIKILWFYYLNYVKDK